MPRMQLVILASAVASRYMPRGINKIQAFRFCIEYNPVSPGGRLKTDEIFQGNMTY